MIKMWRTRKMAKRLKKCDALAKTTRNSKKAAHPSKKAENGKNVAYS